MIQSRTAPEAALITRSVIYRPYRILQSNHFAEAFSALIKLQTL